ncbi:hypothetical protein D3C85_1553480 [compost metagenome]
MMTHISTAYIAAVSAICTHEITPFKIMTTEQNMYEYSNQIGRNGFNLGRSKGITVQSLKP